MLITFSSSTTPPRLAMTNFSSRERKVTTMVSVSSGSQVGEEEQDLANQRGALWSRDRMPCSDWTIRTWSRTSAGRSRGWTWGSCWMRPPRSGSRCTGYLHQACGYNIICFDVFQDVLLYCHFTISGKSVILGENRDMSCCKMFRAHLEQCWPRT